MVYSYNEYRLKEINDLLAMGIDDFAPQEAEQLRRERDEILHNIRHQESLPSNIK